MKHSRIRMFVARIGDQHFELSEKPSLKVTSGSVKSMLFSCVV